MSKKKENVIEVDKISYVHYNKVETPSGVKVTRAFVDFYLDGKRLRMVFNVKE